MDISCKPIAWISEKTCDHIQGKPGATLKVLFLLFKCFYISKQKYWLCFNVGGSLATVNTKIW